MALTTNQKLNIENKLKYVLRDKFKTYKPETSYMPFHTLLLGKDRMALFSFIHSLNTNFGTSIFEPVAVELGREIFKTSASHTTAGNIISLEAQKVIQSIMDDLTSATIKPVKKDEIEMIRNVCQKGPMKEIKPTVVDIFLESHDGEQFLIDLKTAKPNKGGFKEFKRTLLEWVAVILSQKPDTAINTLIAIPYNPYEPKPYARWTMAGMLDLEDELKVAKEFWDFIGGKGAYEDILQCFENVGLEMRGEIDKYFAEFNNKLK